MRNKKSEEKFKEIIKSVIRKNYYWRKKNKKDKELAEECIEKLKTFWGGKIFAYKHDKGLGAVIPLPHANNKWTDEIFEIYGKLREFYGEKIFIDWSETNNPNLKKFTNQDNNLLVILIENKKEGADKDGR